MKQFIKAVGFGAVVTVLIVHDFLATKSGRLLFRLCLGILLIVAGVYLAVMSNAFNAPSTSNLSFWGSLVVGLGMMYVGVLILWRTFVLPAKREFLRGRGITS